MHFGRSAREACRLFCCPGARLVRWSQGVRAFRTRIPDLATGPSDEIAYSLLERRPACPIRPASSAAVPGRPTCPIRAARRTRPTPFSRQGFPIALESPAPDPHTFLGVRPAHPGIGPARRLCIGAATQLGPPGRPGWLCPPNGKPSAHTRPAMPGMQACAGAYARSCRARPRRPQAPPRPALAAPLGGGRRLARLRCVYMHVSGAVSGCQGVRVSGCQGGMQSKCQGVRVSGCQGVRVSGCQGVQGNQSAGLIEKERVSSEQSGEFQTTTAKQTRPRST